VGDDGGGGGSRGVESGFDRYRSVKSSRPKAEMGNVEYTGMEVKNGIYLQQCAYAPICEIVGWVRRMSDSCGVTLYSSMLTR